MNFNRKMLNRMYEVKHEVFGILHDQNHTMLYCNVASLYKLAHLTNKSEKINNLNKFIKRNEANIPHWNGKTQVFI